MTPNPDVGADNIARLENDGYVEGNNLCPACGTMMFEKENSYVYGDEEELYEMLYECPYCGHWFIHYDD